jgi:hypothetical protein
VPPVELELELEEELELVRPLLEEELELVRPLLEEELELELEEELELEDELEELEDELEEVVPPQALSSATEPATIKPPASLGLKARKKELCNMFFSAKKRFCYLDSR